MKRARPVILQILGVFFLIVVIGAFIGQAGDKDFSQNVVLPLVVVSLTFGALSIAMANLLKNNKENKWNEEVMRYRHMAEDFISSGFYFIFAYTFWSAIDFIGEPKIFFWESVQKTFIGLFIFSVIGATGLLMQNLWKLIKELN